MERVQKFSNTECYTPSPEPFDSKCLTKVILENLTYYGIFGFEGNPINYLQRKIASAFVSD
jgi:hypothetical protein